MKNCRNSKALSVVRSLLLKSALLHWVAICGTLDSVYLAAPAGLASDYYLTWPDDTTTGTPFSTKMTS